MEAVTKRLIGLTDLAHSIANRHAEQEGCKSLSEWIEWVILCQEFPPDEAASLLALRKQRGGRGGVIVVPDHFALPPEG